MRLMRGGGSTINDGRGAGVYRNMPLIIKAKKIIAAAKSNTVTIFLVRVALRGRRRVSNLEDRIHPITSPVRFSPLRSRSVRCHSLVVMICSPLLSAKHMGTRGAKRQGHQGMLQFK
jgi:hypothetical protein